MANHERQHSKFTACVNTSQQGNWQNFRNAQFKREVTIYTIRSRRIRFAPCLIFQVASTPRTIIPRVSTLVMVRSVSTGSGDGARPLDPRDTSRTRSLIALFARCPPSRVRRVAVSGRNVNESRLPYVPILDFQPIILTPGWFVTLPKYGVLRFDYVSTSRPDHHQIPLPERRFQVRMVMYFCSGVICQVSKKSQGTVA